MYARECGHVEGGAQYMQHSHAHFDKVGAESDRPGQGGYGEGACEVCV